MFVDDAADFIQSDLPGPEKSEHVAARAAQTVTKYAPAER
jgi:hypothetical protein